MTAREKLAEIIEDEVGVAYGQEVLDALVSKILSDPDLIDAIIREFAVCSHEYEIIYQADRDTTAGRYKETKWRL